MNRSTPALIAFLLGHKIEIYHQIANRLSELTVENEQLQRDIESTQFAYECAKRHLDSARDL